MKTIIKSNSSITCPLCKNPGRRFIQNYRHMFECTFCGLITYLKLLHNIKPKTINH